MFEELMKKLEQEFTAGGSDINTKKLPCHKSNPRGIEVAESHIKQRLEKVKAIIIEIAEHPCACQKTLDAAVELYGVINQDLVNHECMRHMRALKEKLKEDKKSTSRYVCKECDIDLADKEVHFCPNKGEHVLFEDCSRIIH